MARTAGGVDDAKPKQGLLRIGRVRRQSLLDQRVETRTEQLDDQAVGRVVGAREAALGCTRITRGRVTDEAEGPGLHLNLNHGVQFEQAFIDGAQLFRPHIAVVHPLQAGFVLEVTESGDRGEHPLVGQGACIQQRALHIVKQAAKRRNSERCRAVCQRLEGNG